MDAEERRLRWAKQKAIDDIYAERARITKLQLQREEEDKEYERLVAEAAAKREAARLAEEAEDGDEDDNADSDGDDDSDEDN